MSEPYNDAEARNERNVTAVLRRSGAEHLDANDFAALEASDTERIGSASGSRAAAHLRRCDPCAASQVEWVMRYVATHDAATGSHERDEALQSATLARLVAHDEPSVSIAASRAVPAMGLWTDEVVSALMSAREEQLDPRAAEAAVATLGMWPAAAVTETTSPASTIAAMATEAGRRAVAAWSHRHYAAKVELAAFLDAVNLLLRGTAAALATGNAPLAHHEEGPYRWAVTKVDDGWVLDIVSFVPELVGQRLEVKVKGTRVAEVVMTAASEGGRDCVKARKFLPSMIWQAPGLESLEVLPLN